MLTLRPLIFLAAWSLTLMACSVIQATPTSPAPISIEDVTPVLQPNITPSPSATSGSAQDATPSSSPTLTPPPGAFQEAEVLTHNRVNLFRDSQSLTSMAFNEAISAVARKHSEDMLRRRFFEHINPDGVSPQQRVEAAGLDDFSCGENLYKVENARSNDARTIAEDAFEGWFNSLGHYKNMVTPKWNVGGVGVFVERKFLEGDAVPVRYDIFVTHLLCRDISEYKRLLAEYERASTLYKDLLGEFERLENEYSAAQERYRRREAKYSEVEAAYARLQEAQDRLNAQVQVVNDLVRRLNAEVEAGA